MFVWFVMLFVMVDLDFDVGAMVFYFVFCSAEFIIVIFFSKRLHSMWLARKGWRKQQHGTQGVDVVWFADANGPRCMGEVQDEVDDDAFDWGDHLAWHRGRSTLNRAPKIIEF